MSFRDKIPDATVKNKMKKLGSIKKLKKQQQEPLFCKYVHRMCTQTRLDGFDYCIRHILKDRGAPFRQCSYTNLQNRKRCTNAAPKNDKQDSLMKFRKGCSGSLKFSSSASSEKSLCPFHAKRALCSAKTVPQKKRPAENLTTAFASLERYCQDPCHNHWYDPSVSKSDYYDALPTDGGHVSDMLSLGSNQENHSTFLDQTWWGNSDDSEPEIADNELDDPLRHAGWYTIEEITRITRDKLIRLQSLYIEQFKRLQHVLREKRRNYLHEVKVEKKSFGSIHSTPKQIREQAVQYEKLKAYNRYHRRSGTEAVLKQQAMEKRRAVTDGPSYQPPHFPVCIFLDNGEKCNEKAVVMSKFCFNHILCDPDQVLFTPCCGGRGDCMRPVLPLAENNVCLLHITIHGLTSDRISMFNPSILSVADMQVDETVQLPTNPKSKVELSKKSRTCFACPLKNVIKGRSGKTSSSSTHSDADIMSQEPEHFQSMDDIASLGLDAVVPGSLFGLNQFGEPGESTDSALSGDQTDLMQIQPITLNTSDMICESRKSAGSDVDK